jgi:predicted Fe-Mo cluster-binding NifX family protein
MSATLPRSTTRIDVVVSARLAETPTFCVITASGGLAVNLRVDFASGSDAASHAGTQMTTTGSCRLSKASPANSGG